MRDDDKEKVKITRKEFLRRSGLLALGASMAPWAINLACSGKPAEAETAGTAVGTVPLPNVSPTIIAKNASPYDLTRKAVDALGGMKKYVRIGQKVAMLPNIGWARTPEQAANTHPDVVRALVDMCFEAEAKQVEVFCNPCVNAKVSYDKSGIAKVFLSGMEDYQEMEFPDAVWSKHNLVAKARLNADVFINCPIAKHHGLCRLTLIQKNLLGTIYHRGQLHQHIHQEVNALQKVLPADLYVLDCTRILLRNGPTGGSLDDVKIVGQVVAGNDPIAIEAYAASLFDVDPATIGFIKSGQDAGLGNMDVEGKGYVVV
jgi:uncharacterized protein (DUF362 family)